MNFLLYCDYGKEVGAGHLSRICSLGEELLTRNCEFYIIASEDAQRSTLIETKISHNFINFKELHKASADILIIDSYRLNVSRFLEEYKIKASRAIQIIDDISLPAQVDSYIPASPISKTNLKKFDKNKILFSDKEFALLFRDRILNASGLYNRISNKIVITLGYYSDQHLLRKLVEAINLAKLHTSIFIPNVFYGLDWPKNVFFYAPESYLEEVCNCTLVITAAGISILELVFLNIPTLHIIVADNQKYQSDYLVKNALSIKLDIQVNVEAVASQIKNHFSHSIKPDSKVFSYNKLKRDQLVEIMLSV